MCDFPETFVKIDQIQSPPSQIPVTAQSPDNCQPIGSQELIRLRLLRCVLPFAQLGQPAHIPNERAANCSTSEFYEYKQSRSHTAPAAR